MVPFNRESKLIPSNIKQSKLDVIDEDLLVEDANENELEHDHKKLKAMRQNKQPSSNFDSMSQQT
jgi:hypothetical protein